MASASRGVNVMTLLLPKLTPPVDAAPGITSRLFAPMLAMVFCTARLLPWPISVMAITAATPMTMPSVVNAERMTLRRSARSGCSCDATGELVHGFVFGVCVFVITWFFS